MSLDAAASSEDILNAFEKATTTFNLCPNRVWAVARHDLPTLIPAAKAIQCLDDHKQCTIDFCEYSQRDFTAVKQRHECGKERLCRPRLFPQDTLVQAAKHGKPTVWTLDGDCMLSAHRPYMAISHVWSDGTGTGSLPAGEVHACLYSFFRKIAKAWECQGIWWDTISIPKEKSARAKSIRRIQSSYQDSRMTLVHDCFLRNTNWVDAEAACFAILMSPWFSRGWTALELANSRKVKVLFKGHNGLVLKDLDEEILAKDDHASDAHKRATDLIKTLRKGVTTLNDLLVVLGARCTSWPKDMAVISGLLVGVSVSPEGEGQDVLQQDIYKRVLTKIGRLATEHLFHNSATICGGLSWCPTNLFSMPISGQSPSLTVETELDLVGTWDIIPMNDDLKQNCIWHGTHSLLRMQLQVAMQDIDKCVLFTECGTQIIERALLVKAMRRQHIEGSVCFQYVGALHFHPGLPKTDHITIEAIILGDASSHVVTSQANAWECVKKMANIDRDRFWQPEKSGSQEIQNEAIKALWPTEDQPIRRERGTGRTALHYAVLRGDLISFQQLLKISDSTVKDALGKLPLHLAAERGDRKMLSDLLDNLFDSYPSDILRRHTILHTTCRDGQTILHSAVFSCSEAVMDMLLNFGVDPNIVGSNKNTALHIAVGLGCEPVIERLLTAGADPNLTNKDGNTALHLAIRSGFESAIRRLISEPRCDIDIANNLSITPLFDAILLEHEWLVRLLVEKGADVNKACASRKKPPLQEAIFSGNHAIIEFLINNGADLNAKDINHLALLHVAVTKGDRTTMSLLLNKGAKIDVRDQSRLTPLHYAARRGSKASVMLLLSNGADPNAKGWCGFTPFGLTPLDFATRKGHDEVAVILKKNGA